MNRIKFTAGIIWAIACLLLMIILYFALGTFSARFASLPFMKLNPNVSGGEIAQQKVMDNCTTMIRKPVFDGFLAERKRGFVQVDWRGNLGETINDTIDFDMDHSPDFIIGINTLANKVDLQALNPRVRKVGLSAETSHGWSVRVDLDK